MPAASTTDRWPELPSAAWRDTRDTLHLWTQVVGKIRLALTPWLNHSWHVALYVTARGLTTSPIPDGARSFQIDFDFIDHVLWIRTSDGHYRQVMLRPMAVAEFYAETMAALAQLGIDVAIRTMPCEIADCIAFEQDTVHAAYDAAYANRFWRVLVSAHRVLAHFRTAFLGKVAPVHFFWGSFDLAVTRFSGRRAPRHPGGVPHLPDSGGARGLFARGVERGLLAGRRRTDRLCGVLLLRLSGAGRFRGGEGETRRRRFSARTWANSFCLTTPCAKAATRTPR